ncbi:MAG: CHAT domain-containing tetratricopeptide repeat protein [Saprospiraceae bacterium]
MVKEQRADPALLDCPGGPDSLGRAYHAAGVAAYREANLVEAAKFTERSLELKRRPGAEVNPLLLGKSCHNLGAFYLKLDRDHAAQPVLEEAIEIYAAIDEPNRREASRLELARYYGKRGNYGRANELLRLTLAAARQYDLPRRAAAAYLDLGNNLNELGDYAAAADTSRLAAQLFAQLGREEDLANARINLGAARYALADYAAAQAAYRQALEYFQPKEDWDKTGMLYNNLSLVCLKQGKREEALELARLGTEVARLSDSPVIRAQGFDNQGEIFLEAGETAAALVYFKRATDLLLIPEAASDQRDGRLAESKLVASPYPLDLLSYLQDEILAAEAAAPLPDSEQLDRLRAADRLIDKIRQEHDHRLSRLFWRRQALPFYESAVRLLHRAGRNDDAFYYLEKSKAVLLLDALTASDAAALIPDSLTTRLESLKTAADRQSPPGPAANRARREYEELHQRLLNRYPAYALARRLTPVPSVADFRGGGSGALLHFLVGKERVYVYYLDDEQNRLLDLGNTAALNLLAADLLTFFRDDRQIITQPLSYGKAAAALYDYLLRPLDLPTGRTLIVVPDGILNQIPFDALLTDQPENDYLVSYPYLILRNPVRYAYSASLLYRADNRSARSRGECLVLAPFAKAGAGTDLAALPPGEAELRSWENCYAPLILRDGAADRQALFNREDEGGWLHLSTHAFSSATEEDPRLLLGDGPLYLSELYAARLPAELVVLSACRSNLGVYVPGEGMLGLGRGFTQAGAGGVVAGLWNLNAEATGSITADFYRRMAEGLPKFQALNDAKLALLQDPNVPGYRKSPYYWAGLTYYGDSRALSGSGQNRATPYLICCGLLSILLLGWFCYRRSR